VWKIQPHRSGGTVLLQHSVSDTDDVEPWHWGSFAKKYWKAVFVDWHRKVGSDLSGVDLELTQDEIDAVAAAGMADYFAAEHLLQQIWHARLDNRKK